MDSDGGELIIIALIIAAILFIIYIITIIATAVLSIAAASGTIWGGGRAIMNYGLSFKEHMIDSNRVAV